MLYVPVSLFDTTAAEVNIDEIPGVMEPTL